MVSNTETMNANEAIQRQRYGGGPSPAQASSAAATVVVGGGGAIGRLRQTLQQAQETVSNRLTQTRAGYQQPAILLTTDQQANEQNLSGTGADSQQNVQGTGTPSEEKENQEAA